MSPTDPSISPSVPEGLLEDAAKLCKRMVSDIAAIVSTRGACTVSLGSMPLYLADSVLTLSVEIRPKLPADQMNQATLQRSQSVITADAFLAEKVEKSRIH